MIKSLFCMVTGHRVNRNRVWHDGRNFRTKCTQCREPMIRELGEWRRFDLESDADETRQPHPHTGEAA
ncbi:hypothetical protein [Pontixanthobacter aquaemixtae]|uniref:Uncharacterized protein n=1 Tax=Pontixanthobacter aquaemixtae TaxID=1958940 RepID=A0A844ZUK6_9SPHN|nr:hypothetical protein [Pontixanthobacter aquaemixtae]MXO90666.1 hypothetical protein [Pontixanthobacter aquaemixtae]